MAKIKRFEVEVALIPLLRGKIEIRRLVLVEPDILIESDKSGRSKLMFETANQPSSAPPEGETQGKETRLPLVAIENAQIEKRNILYKDGRSGKTYTVTLENLTTTTCRSLWCWRMGPSP